MRNWRAGTITLGLALIGFGVSMLVGKISGMFTLMDVVVWWPVLLIILGCEVLASQFLLKEKALKVKFDGGSVFLIVVILLFSMGLSAFGYAVGLLPEGMETFKSAVFDERAVIEKEYSIDSGSIHIDNNAGGNITLIPSDDSKAHIEAVVTIDNITPEKANGCIDTVISADTGKGRISTFLPGLSESLHRTRVDFNIRIPVGIKVEVINAHGNIEVSDVNCDINIDNKDGMINVNRVNGDLAVSSMYGNMRVFGISGNVSIKNRYSSVYIAEPDGKLDIKSDNGRVELLAGNILAKDVSIHTVNGDAKIVFAESQTGILKAASYSGNISTNISTDIIDDGGAKKIDAVLEGEGPVFDISANNGSIELFVGKME